MSSGQVTLGPVSCLPWARRGHGHSQVGDGVGLGIGPPCPQSPVTSVAHPASSQAISFHRPPSSRGKEPLKVSRRGRQEGQSHHPSAEMYAAVIFRNSLADVPLWSLANPTARFIFTKPNGDTANWNASPATALPGSVSAGLGRPQEHAASAPRCPFHREGSAVGAHSGLEALGSHLLRCACLPF